jgi:hypothetical protein
MLIQTFGHDQLQIDFGDQLFQSVLFTPSANAFEYTNMQASDPLVTPILPTLPLFASGLGALGLLGWRRKKKAQHSLRDQRRGL